MLKVQHNWEQSILLLRLALANKEEKFGQTHKQTVKVVDQLAHNLCQLEKYNELEALFRRILKATIDDKGLQYEETIKWMLLLSRTLYHQKNDEEAELLTKNILEAVGTNSAK